MSGDFELIHFVQTCANKLAMQQESQIFDPQQLSNSIITILQQNFIFSVQQLATLSDDILKRLNIPYGLIVFMRQELQSTIQGYNTPFPTVAQASSPFATVPQQQALVNISSESSMLQKPAKVFKLMVMNNNVSHQPEEPNEVRAFVEQVHSKRRKLTFGLVFSIIVLLVACFILVNNLMSLIAVLGTFYYNYLGTLIASSFSLVEFIIGLPLLIIALVSMLLLFKARTNAVQTVLQKYRIHFVSISIEQEAQYYNILFTLK